MRTTTASFDLNVKHLAAAVLLIAAAGSSYAAANTSADADKGAQAKVQQVVKQQSKSAIKRQEIQQKVANREPLSYEETLYLR
ncbi:hypothetical protein PMI16_02024 [Herbaspirillum sp. CF444]|uniref:hypothetical protein n=1 Tax=Herbaspirillum sp. CF444 TaxID=1144319 RepID=UPI00027257BD|nr:hypothetical protein [Herbaspirillum sp. CF444]EJL89157.1 hypothetical protein PMI16_02024 [Herbaspirillum sp. CF444]